MTLLRACSPKSGKKPSNEKRQKQKTPAVIAGVLKVHLGSGPTIMREIEAGPEGPA